MTEPDEALLWARWAMRGYSRPSDVAIPLTAPLRIDGRRLSGVEAHNLTEALAETYRAGAAASAERIKELEARVAELEAALKPLAALAEKIGTKPKDESCWCGQDGAVIRFGDIRRARALLKEGER